MQFGHQQIEGMVIDVLVDVEGPECVKGLLVCERFRHKVCSKNGNEMGCAYDGVEVYDGDLWVSSVIEFRLHDPQTGVFVWLLLEMFVPVDEGAGVGFPFKSEAKKHPDSDNRHSEHSRNIRVGAEERTVVSGGAFPP